MCGARSESLGTSCVNKMNRVITLFGKGFLHSVLAAEHTHREVDFKRKSRVRSGRN